MNIFDNNNPQQVYDQHYSLDCPHCGTHSNITAISIPRFEFLKRFQPEKVGIVYRCDACNAPIFLRFRAYNYNNNNSVTIDHNEYEEVERPQETFEYKYLPEAVAEDFREALSCYSHLNYNAFAAMCRRTAQSVFTELGTEGKDRVMNQLKDAKDLAEMDDETYQMLEQIIIAGHDGAHPHLPKVSAERAKLLLVLMKDVLTQLFVRKKKIQESTVLRKGAIAAGKEEGVAGGG